MKYTIVTIDDSRAAKKAAIRNTVRLEEVTDIKFVDGREMRPIQGNLTGGELGVWLSQMECWKWAEENGDLLVFEDDAMLADDFMERMEEVIAETPDDWDTISLFVPDNQRPDFYYNAIYNTSGTYAFSGMPKVLSDKTSKYLIGSKVMAKAYQGYSLVATIFSKQGAKKLLDRAVEIGVEEPVDCFVFMAAHSGNLNSYAPRPTYPAFVSIDWNAESVRAPNG